jgi:hypothetical protein
MDRKTIFEIFAGAAIGIASAVAGVMAKTYLDPAQPIVVTKPMPAAAALEVDEVPIVVSKGQGQPVSLHNGYGW